MNIRDDSQDQTILPTQKRLILGERGGWRRAGQQLVSNDSTECSHSCHGAEARLREAEVELEQLKFALTHRAEIEQAKGIIMAGRDCTADEAFRILVNISQHENKKLREIAVRIVTRRAIPANHVPRPSDLKPRTRLTSVS